MMTRWVVVALVAAACTSSSSHPEGSCPCGEGSFCCKRTNTCVRDMKDCEAGTASSSSGVPVTSSSGEIQDAGGGSSSSGTAPTSSSAELPDAGVRDGGCAPIPGPLSTMLLAYTANPDSPTGRFLFPDGGAQTLEWSRRLADLFAYFPEDGLVLMTRPDGTGGDIMALADAVTVETFPWPWAWVELPDGHGMVVCSNTDLGGIVERFQFSPPAQVHRSGPVRTAGLSGCRRVWVLDGDHVVVAEDHSAVTVDFTTGSATPWSPDLHADLTHAFFHAPSGTVVFDVYQAWRPDGGAVTAAFDARNLAEVARHPGVLLDTRGERAAVLGQDGVRVWAPWTGAAALDPFPAPPSACCAVVGPDSLAVASYTHVDAFQISSGEHTLSFEDHSQEDAGYATMPTLLAVAEDARGVLVSLTYWQSDYGMTAGPVALYRDGCRADLSPSRAVQRGGTMFYRGGSTAPDLEVLEWHPSGVITSFTPAVEPLQYLNLMAPGLGGPY